MNIVILTIGRSGSSVVAGMLCEMGWGLPNVDEYSENITFRRLNSEPWSNADASRFIKSLAPPWVLKDPRFVWTWEAWQPLLDQQGNLLLWLTRDLVAIEKSLRAKRWGKDSPRGWLLRNQTLPDHDAECWRCFEAWSGPKIKIAYENLQKAFALFDPTRGTRR